MVWVARPRLLGQGLCCGPRRHSWWGARTFDWVSQRDLDMAVNRLSGLNKERRVEALRLVDRLNLGH
jgi:hypothetical protein